MERSHHVDDYRSLSLEKEVANVRIIDVDGERFSKETEKFLVI